MFSFEPPVTNENFTDKLRNATSTKERRDVYLQMGNWYYNTEKPDSALPYYRLALQTSDSIRLNDDSHYSILLGLIRSIKDTAQQREYFQSALKTMEMTDGDQHSTTADLLQEFGSNDMPNIPDSEKLQFLQRALEITRNIRSKPQEYDILGKISYLYEKKGDIVLAESLLVRSMHVMYGIQGMQLHNAHILADFYSRTGRDSLGLLVLYQHEKYIDTTNYAVSLMLRTELFAHEGWIALKRNDTAFARNIFLSANNIWIKEKEHFYSYIRARNSLDLCYVLLKTGQIEAARKEFHQLQSELKPEIMDALDKAAPKVKKYYMDWEYRRQEAHSYVLHTLTRPDGKTNGR
jgi:tetratricopeptide (TPR) repeat protein